MPLCFHLKPLALPLNRNLSDAVGCPHAVTAHPSRFADHLPPLDE